MGTEQMTDRFQYVWTPYHMCDEWKGGLLNHPGYTAIAFAVEGQWHIFVDVTCGHALPRFGEVEMITEGDIFDYGKTLWELSR